MFALEFSCEKSSIVINEMSRVIRKPALYINKGADQLCGNCAADQHLCFHCIDNAIHQLF